MKKLPFFVVLLAPMLFGCGDNLTTPTTANPFSPPSGLKAFSVNQSSVNIQWSGTTDSTVQAYIAQVGTRTDTLSRSTLAFVANSLPSGESAFSVYSLRTDGQRSNAATIRWAPAARFDSAYALYESNTLVSTRPEGFNVGTSTTAPSTMVLNLIDPVVQQTLDLFINGDSVQTHQSLSMWSANLLRAPFNHTLFSTQTDASPSLDFALGAFPQESSFIKDSITVVDNTIYYARVIGDPLQINYARLHLHIRPGTTLPNRIIEVRVSLQRVPGLLYALEAEEFTHDFVRSLKLFTIVNYNHS